MKPIATRAWVAALLLLVGQAAALAQTAAVNRNVNLRRDPSTTSPVIELLRKPERLVLVDAAPQNGFLHVHTEDDEVGWVWSRFVDFSNEAPAAGAVAHTRATTTSDAQCNAALWQHVYHAQRLMVVEQCTSVTGTIVDATAGKQADGLRHEKDGDMHGWLKPDPAYASLLNAGNRSSEGGNLVFEVICRFPVTQPDAKAACAGFPDAIPMPPVRSHVRIVGSYLQDTLHAQWMEIHPVTSITVIP